MANNLYDYLNQFNLGQLVSAGNTALQGAANTLNRAGIGTRGIQQRPSYYGPAYASAEALGIKPGGLRDYGPGYKEKELAAGQAAENFRPGAGFPGQQAERDYQQKKSRVEQLTKQDPELQRYERARAGAKTQQEMDAARDIGMAMWAKANPKLAAKVKPGQSGYEVIQNELNAGQMGPVMDLPFDTTRPFSPTPVPPEQLSVTYEGVRPASLGEVTPIVGGGFPTEQAAMFERFQQAISPSQPTFQGSPLGTGTPLVGNLAYTGSIAPLGTAVEGGNFRSDKAQKLAEMFKKAQFSS